MRCGVERSGCCSAEPPGSARSCGCGTARAPPAESEVSGLGIRERLTSGARSCRRSAPRGSEARLDGGAAAKLCCATLCSIARGEAPRGLCADGISERMDARGGLCRWCSPAFHPLISTCSPFPLRPQGFRGFPVLCRDRSHQREVLWMLPLGSSAQSPGCWVSAGLPRPPACPWAPLSYGRKGSRVKCQCWQGRAPAGRVWGGDPGLAAYKALSCTASGIKASRALPVEPAWGRRTNSRNIPVCLPSST